MSAEPNIRLHGRRYLFIGNDERTDGGIATRRQYDNFVPGYAHLYPDGNIRRYGVVIGTRDDIEWVEDMK